MYLYNAQICFQNHSQTDIHFNQNKEESRRKYSRFKGSGMHVYIKS